MTNTVKRLGILALLGGALTTLACNGDDDAPVETAEIRGERVYKNVCATCHAANPNEEGVLGPPIADASLELLTARIVHGNYPAGYTPKRTTKQMVALPHLEPTIPDLAAFLASVKN